MLTFIFLGFFAIVAICAIVISVKAKRRDNGTVQRPASVVGDTPSVGRADGRGDD